MKSRLFPVIVTAALTSVVTLFVAARYQQSPLFLSDTHHASLPVNYSFTGNTTTALAGVANFEDAAAASVKAVVHVKTTTKARTVMSQDDGDDFFGGLFGRRQYYVPQQMGSGSGVVISPDGYIVTNNHVVADANELTVTFNDRYTTTAKVIGTDPATDIAVLKVNEKDLAYMEFGNSDNVKLGQWVLAVGYPLSLDATVTAGIVSAKGRSIGINRSQSASAIESFIQTDAAVNPGNSGGALVNTAGQLIGINSAIASPTGSYAGYSYAIPANIVKKAVNDLMKYGKVERGYLGVGLVDRKNMSAEELTKLGIDRAEGVYVASVMPNSGSAKAGLEKGDFITKVNGDVVNSEPELLGEIARYHPGDNVSINYTRGGKSYTTNVELRKDQGNITLLGASFKALSDQEKGKLKLKSGLMVIDLGNGALAKQTNMRKGFVITSANDMAVNSADDLQKALSDNGNVQLAGIYPGYQGYYYYGINNADIGE